MKYEVKNYSHLLGTPGFSDPLLNNHFTLYKGYVDNTNKLWEYLKELEAQGKTDTPAYAELKRRFGWEYNGMRLHEYYFSNMSKEKQDLPQNNDFQKIIAENFGSFENWKKDFIASGAMRGIGWVILYADMPSNRLFNAWINEHDQGHLSGATPLLVMDVFEHAYVLDYGLKKADYINAFFNAINWKEVVQRYETAVRHLTATR
jgi:Fe-Mn family superoxide dismutase